MMKKLLINAVFYRRLSAEKLEISFNIAIFRQCSGCEKKLKYFTCESNIIGVNADKKQTKRNFFIVDYSGTM
jgi:hypothetical protein